MNLENEIITAKMQAKWKADTQRRIDVIKALDYYRNHQAGYLLSALKEGYPKTYAALYKFKDIYNLTENVIDEIAIIFEEPPVYSFIDEVSDEIKDQFSELINNSLLNPTLQMVDKYVELVKKCGVIPHWDEENKKVILEILTPDKVYVIQDDLVTSKAKEVWVQIGIKENTAHIAEKTVKYMRWTAEEKQIIYVNPDTGRKYKEEAAGKNPYDKIPIVWFTGGIEEDNFWFDFCNYLVEKNEIINMDLTAARLGTTVQSYSNLVLKGFDKSQDITIGVLQPIIIPPDPTTGEPTGDASYITPDADLKKIYAIIDGKIVSAANSKGISATSYRKEGSTFSSGYQLKLSKVDVLKRNMRKRPFYSPKMIDLIQFMMQCFTMNSAKNRFPEDKKIKADFGEIKIDENPAEQAKVDALRLNQNLTSGPRLLQRDNPDLTLDEAKRLYAEIKAENQEFSVGAGLAAAIGIEVEE